MNNNLVRVKIRTSNYYKLLLKISKMDISILDIDRYNNYVIIKITISDYEKIKNVLQNYNIEIYDVLGIIKIKNTIFKHLVFFISCLLAISLLFIANNMIFKINIICSNEEIKEIILEDLNRFNLSPMHFKKRHKEIEGIVKEITKKNKNLIEFLEIAYDGLIMNVVVQERMNYISNKEHPFCDIVAKKEAKIVGINIQKGEMLKTINDYVYKGETIISGTIKHNDEIKNTVCAQGTIYGEVWSKVIINYPLEEESIIYTGKKRYNIEIKSNNDEYMVFKSRVKFPKKEKERIYTYNNFEINLVKEVETKKIMKKLSEKEALNKALTRALQAIKIKLNSNEEIKYQKVLKKEINDSKIYLEVFVITKEIIGEVKILEEVAGSGI